MSFCRITGKARGLPKPNYFPLLPPISPADAKRFCRITGKAYGLPGHHYTPVLLVRQAKRRACPVTGGAAGGNEKHHFPCAPDGTPLPPTPEETGSQRHVVVADFRYVFPTLEESEELGEILSAQKENAFPSQEEKERRFVYTVGERRCSLVIPARLEAAVRDGEVKGVLLAEDADEVRFQFKKGKDVTVGVKDLSSPHEHELWEGEGPSEAAQAAAAEAEKPKKKNKKRKKEGLSCMTKIFEEKERVQEAELLKTEEIKAKRAKVVEVKLSATDQQEVSVEGDTSGVPQEAAPVKWEEYDPNAHRVDANLVMCSGDWRDLVKPLIESWDWEEFEREAGLVAQGITVTILPKPVPLRAETAAYEPAPEAIPSVEAAVEAVVSGAGTLPLATSVAPLAPLTAQPSAEVQTAIKSIAPKALARTSGVVEAVAKDEEARKMMPTVEEIPQIMASLDKGKPGKIGGKAHGLVLDIGAAKRFVAGQTLDTPSGKVFVPGQTLSTPTGPTFIPGMTVLGEDATPVLIPGQCVDTPAAGPCFVAGRTLLTASGEERFVAGQTVATPDGPVFMPGQTLMTAEGPRFIPGQTIAPPEGSSAPARFIPGHTLASTEGPRFVSGQSITAPDGTVQFVAGQNVCDPKTGQWDFVPGQIQPGPNGVMCFVAGQTIPTPEGPRFVPGRTVTTDSGATEFVPGVTVEESDGSLRFVPGRTIQTAEGPKFVEGQVVHTEKGPVFAPGKIVSVAEGQTPQFSIAKSLDDAVVAEAAAAAAVAAVVAETEEATTEATFGHMVQTGKGVAFFPGTRASGLPAGKLVPGRLIRSATSGDVKFIPGIEVVEDSVRRFVPGQVVQTERGENFVPGEVIDTAEGPKFVPGQVIQTRSGEKFVPGQTIDTPQGPRFVPGQIIDTKAGPTFIPGQVISTAEEGSRFVPGQVVETAEGPRFVPGRVVETGDRVTFIPGQVVETKEGLRFVAPDLTDNSEFSVQGFEVTPEELKLLRPATTAATAETVAALDSNVLRQLSEAGVAVGRHVPADLPGIAVAEDAVLASTTVRDLSGRLQLHTEETVQLADVLGTVVRLGTELLEQARSPRDLQRLKAAAVDAAPGSEESVKEFVRSLVSAVALTASQHPAEQMLHCAGEVLGELLCGVDAPAAATLVQSLHAFLSAPGSVRELRNDARAILRAECKLDMLRTLVKEAKAGEGGEMATEESAVKTEDGEFARGAVERLAAVLGDQGREEVMGGAFARLIEDDPALVGQVLGRVSKTASHVTTERDASEAVQRAIVSAVKETSDRKLRSILEVDDLAISEETEEELRSLVGEAIGLARALGLFDAADSLLDVLDDPTATRALAHDAVAMDVLRRLTVMRSLAARRPAHVAALRRLQQDPFEARDDPHLRELVRDSAVLLVEPINTNLLASSADVPAALLLADNRLAVEDFLARTGHRAGPLLILKPGLQTVIPREASRAVLTGQCAYTVLDANGIRYFEPLHVLSALRLPRVATHRFTMYRCAVATDGSLTSSSEDLGVSFASTSAPSTRRRSSGGQPLASQGSLDTGTATASPGSDGDFMPRGYLDADTRLRIANALAGYNAPRRRSENQATSSSNTKSVASSRSPSPPPYTPRRFSRPSRANAGVAMRSPSPPISRQRVPSNSPSPTPMRNYNKAPLSSISARSPSPPISPRCNGLRSNLVLGENHAAPDIKGASITSSISMRSPSPPISRRISNILRSTNIASDVNNNSATSNGMRSSEVNSVSTQRAKKSDIHNLAISPQASRESSPAYDSPLTKDYKNLIDYKESSPLRRLSQKYSSFLAKPPSREPSPVKTTNMKNDVSPKNVSNNIGPRDGSPVSRDDSPLGFGSRTTARTVRASSFDDELTPNQRRILKELRSNHVATLRAKEMYGSPSRDGSPSPIQATLPRVLRNISPVPIGSPSARRRGFDREIPYGSSNRRPRFEREFSPVQYVTRDISPVRPISAYIPTYRSRDRVKRGGSKEGSPLGVSLRTTRLLNELAPQEKSTNESSRLQYRSNDVSPSMRGYSSYNSYKEDSPKRTSYSLQDNSPSRLTSSYRANDSSPSGRVINSYLAKEGSPSRSPVGRAVNSYLVKDSSPSSRTVNSYHAKENSPNRSQANYQRSQDGSPTGRAFRTDSPSSRGSSPLTFTPRRTQIRLPDLSPPREFEPSAYRRLSQDVSPIGRTTMKSYGQNRHATSDAIAGSRRLADGKSPLTRTYRLEPMGSLRNGRGPSPDALRLDSVSPTEPLSLGSFRTGSISESESMDRHGTASPDDMATAYRPPPVAVAKT